MRPTAPLCACLPLPAQPCLLLSPGVPCSNCSPLGTWLWGSMPVREANFDETADLYSVSFIGAEVGDRCAPLRLPKPGWQYAV